MQIVMVMDLLMVMHWRCLVNDSIEAIVLVSGVVHSANGTIGLHQRVLALHGVTVACLMLRLDVASVEVVDAILEGILRRGLKHRHRQRERETEKL